MSVSSHIYMPGKAERPRLPREHPGRDGLKARTTAAGWVLDYLVPLNKTILLCFKCNHNFNPKVVNYVSLNQRFGWVKSTCDGCKNPYVNCFMYAHESYLGTRSGQCWDPRYL
jgi:hypothetical protein